MGLPPKDIQVLQHILRYIYEVNTTRDALHITQDSFVRGFAYQNALAMPILQIGECVKKLSQEFRTTFQEIPWKQIAGTRDTFAHKYDHLNPYRLWDTIIEDLPALQAFCEDTISQAGFELPTPRPFIESDEDEISRGQ